MKFEYDHLRDLLYIYFGKPGTKVAKTLTVTPGVHIDIDEKGKLLGIEIIDASEFIGERVEFAFPGVSYAFERTAQIKQTT